MTIRRLWLAAALTLLALPAAAQDATGKWNASVETPNGPFALVFEFMADGDKLTGSMSNDFMGATPITDGMINGGELSFKLKIEGGPGGAMTINYKGMVKGDELALTSTFEGAPPGGGPLEQTLTATRAK
jgi:hypothetical protein